MKGSLVVVSVVGVENQSGSVRFSYVSVVRDDPKSSITEVVVSVVGAGSGESHQASRSEPAGSVVSSSIEDVIHQSCSLLMA